jgi:hypothetical protein
LRREDQGKASMFFSEEKHQKTFSPAPLPWPRSFRGHQSQKSFGSFLQKRTCLLPATLS